MTNTLQLPAGTQVTTLLGAGTVRYTNGEWVGVQLTGETRIDEYPAETVQAAE